MLPRERFLVYGGTGYHDLDTAILNLLNGVTGLGLVFNDLWYHTWPDGEPGFGLYNPQRIKGNHVIVFSCPITAKHKGELRDLVTAAKKQYEAKSVIVVLPFLRFRRQDHIEAIHEITRLRWFLSNLKHYGTSKLIVCDPHSEEHTQKFCDEFGLELFIGDPTRLFAEAIKGVVQTLGGAKEVRLYSPDWGSVERTLKLAQCLETSMVATPKHRADANVSIGGDLNDFLQAIQTKFGKDAPVTCDIKDLTGFHVFMREDEIDTGETAVKTAMMLRRVGAKSIRFVATHPVCSRGWKIRLFPYGKPQPFESIWLGNTRPRGSDESRYEGSTGGRVQEVDMAPVIAATLKEALERISD